MKPARKGKSPPRHLKIGTIWTDPFDTEQAALEAALAAIEEDSDRQYVHGYFGYLLP